MAHPQTEPISRFTFEEGTGLAVGDAQGTNQLCTLDPTSATWVPGVNGGSALNFNGTGMGVTCNVERAAVPLGSQPFTTALCTSHSDAGVSCPTSVCARVHQGLSRMHCPIMGTRRSSGAAGVVPASAMASSEYGTTLRRAGRVADV